jgi:transposase
LLRTLPAVRENAATVWAERGPDPAPYPHEKHLGSWCGLCPGNNRSAGRNQSSPTNQGNQWLRAALTESAGGVARRKEGHLREKFWRIAARGEPKRSRPIAVVAIAHDLLKLAYFVLQRGTP